MNAIRELTAAELDEVAGGFDLVSILVGGAVALASIVVGGDIADGGTDFIEAGKQYLEGKQRPR